MRTKITDFPSTSIGPAFERIVAGQVVSARLAVVIVSLLAIVSYCSKNPVDSDTEDVLMPLTAGNYWASQQLSLPEGLADSAIVTITGDTLVQIDNTAYRAAIQSFTYPIDGTPSDLRWLYWNGTDGLYLMGGISSTDTLVHKMLLYKYPAQEGDSWEIQRLLYSYYTQEYEIEDTTTTYTCVATDEEFNTPAGTFICYVYHHRITIWEEPGLPIEDWDYYEYYAPNVGRVGTLIRSGLDGRLKWKTWLFDYRVD